MAMHHSKNVIDSETDARFWAQTHYKPGQRLDPSNPTDRKMMKVWLDVWGKVKREDRAGELVLTYNHPEVEQGLADAERAHAATDAHVDAASIAPDPDTSRAHAAAASDAAAAASSAGRRASARQPPTVSPVLADIAASEAAREGGVHHPSAIAPLPDDHPAIASPAARPIMTPPDVPLGPIGPVDPEQPGPQPAAAPSTPREHLAINHAMNAPAVAVAVHEDAHARGSAPTMGSLHPRTIAELRDLARRFASDSMGSYLGVAYSPDEQWSVPLFSSAAQAHSWYEHVTDAPDTFRYVAYFDKTAPTWPSPVQELFGSSRTLGAASFTGADAGQAGGKKTPYVAIAAAGAAIVGLAAILAGGRRKTRDPGGRATTRMRTPAAPSVQIFEVGATSPSSKR